MFVWETNFFHSWCFYNRFLKIYGTLKCKFSPELFLDVVDVLSFSLHGRASFVDAEIPDHDAFTCYLWKLQTVVCRSLVDPVQTLLRHVAASNLEYLQEHYQETYSVSIAGILGTTHVVWKQNNAVRGVNIRNSIGLWSKKSLNQGLEALPAYVKSWISSEVYGRLQDQDVLIWTQEI